MLSEQSDIKMIHRFRLVFDKINMKENPIVYDKELISDNYIEDYTQNNFERHPEDFSNELITSYTYEEESIDESLATHIFNYLNSSDVPSIFELYRIMFGEHSIVKRTTHVFIGGKFIHKNDRIISNVLHIGCDPDSYEIDDLQHLVDWFYTNKFKSVTEKFIYAFICYFLYVRIHPHKDGNGRIARLLFFENPKLEHSIIPFMYYVDKLSTRNKKRPGLIGKLYRMYSKYSNVKATIEFEPDNTIRRILNRKITREKYFEINITDEMICDIISFISELTSATKYE